MHSYHITPILSLQSRRHHPSTPSANRSRPKSHPISRPPTPSPSKGSTEVNIALQRSESFSNNCTLELPSRLYVYVTPINNKLPEKQNHSRRRNSADRSTHTLTPIPSGKHRQASATVCMFAIPQMPSVMHAGSASRNGIFPPISRARLNSSALRSTLLLLPSSLPESDCEPR